MKTESTAAEMGHFSCGIGNRLHNRLYFYHAEEDALKYNLGIEYDDPFVVIRAPTGLVTQIMVVQTAT
jgi:hypothetical protein